MCVWLITIIPGSSTQDVVSVPWYLWMNNCMTTVVSLSPPDVSCGVQDTSLSPPVTVFPTVSIHPGYCIREGLPRELMSWGLFQTAPRSRVPGLHMAPHLLCLVFRRLWELTVSDGACPAATPLQCLGPGGSMSPMPMAGSGMGLLLPPALRAICPFPCPLSSFHHDFIAARLCQFQSCSLEALASFPSGQHTMVCQGKVGLPRNGKWARGARAQSHLSEKGPGIPQERWQSVLFPTWQTN